MASSLRKNHFWAALFELLSSMRFAISLLTLLAIASVIGTVLRQNEPYPNYVMEFGQFWFGIFEWFGLYDVYHSVWFLTILLFLVISTSLCIWRNTPGFLRDMRSFREGASETSLAAMSHSRAENTPVSSDHIRTFLSQSGYAFKEKTVEGGTLFAARKGRFNRMGYFAAHSALVLICIGGLIDGNVILKVQQALGWKTPETRSVPQSEIPAKSRLGIENFSFRGNITVPTGSSADVIFLNAGDGYFVQELPFIVELKKFHIEHYSTGQPKLFASDIKVTDKTTGKVTEATVKVNHPLIMDGIAIYQASFGDGGSKLDLMQWNLTGAGVRMRPIQAVSMQSAPIQLEGQSYQMEFGELRPFNIEDISSPADEASKGLVGRLNHASSVKSERKKRNVGPSIQFKLRDSSGQAKEFMNYLAPIEVEGRSYLISGMRSQPNQPFSYVRWPLDADQKIDTFMHLRAVLADTRLHPEMARRTADQALKGGAVSPEVAKDFARSVEWILKLFSEGGFTALERFVEEKVPQDKRQMVAQTYIKILQGTVPEAMDIGQKLAGAAPLARTESNYRFLMDGLVAYSSALEYGAPAYFQLKGFEERKASGLQLTRSPGKNWVYLGSLLMVIGIMIMLYLREMRLWILQKEGSVRISMSANRRSLAFDETFEKTVQTLLEKKE